jgi:RNA-binding protein
MTDNSITSSTRKKYRQIGHHLRPIVTVGNLGVTDGVIEETRRALRDHELIKVKLNIEKKTERDREVKSLSFALDAHFIQLIGKNALLYKKNPNAKSSSLSNVLKYDNV